jgi:hypothetical protein
MNLNSGDVKLNKFEEKYVVKITILIFTKLLAIKIVASNRSGFDKCLIINLSILECSSLAGIRVLGLSEKKAISEAEIKPDMIRNKNKIISPIIILVFNGFTIIKLINKTEKSVSVSKIIFLKDDKYFIQLDLLQLT